MALFGPRAEVSLKIEGMHCAHCQKTVGDALRAVPGVVSANVDLMFHKAKVQYEPGKASPEALVAAVQAAGYEARPASG